MIKLRRVQTDKGFILEEIDKINKKLIDDGKVEPVDLPHVDNTAEAVQDHIDAVKEIVDKEKEEMEKKALETKGEDRAIFAESKLFKDRAEMSSFIVKLREQKIKHRVLPLHEDKEGYRFELKYEKPLDESLNESYETAFEVCEDGSKVSAVGSFKHTKNYTHELVDFDCASGSGSGDYRWMNRPWQRFTFAEALREAMINAGVDEKCARDCIENSYSLKSAIKYFAENCCKKEEVKPEESLKEEAKIVNSGDDIFTIGDIEVKIGRSKGGKEVFASRPSHNYTSIKDLEDDIDALNKVIAKVKELQGKEGVKPLGNCCGNKDESLKEDAEAEVEVEEPKEDEKKNDDKGDEDKKDSKEPKLETFDEQMDFLASDEQEAIDGYEKVLALVEDEHVKAQLEKILEEERAHKDFLEKVKEDPSLEYSHEHEEEQGDSFDDLDGEEIIDVEEDDFDWEPALESVEEDKKEEKKDNLWESLED